MEYSWGFYIPPLDIGDPALPLSKGVGDAWLDLTNSNPMLAKSPVLYGRPPGNTSGSPSRFLATGKVLELPSLSKKRSPNGSPFSNASSYPEQWALSPVPSPKPNKGSRLTTTRNTNAGSPRMGPVYPSQGQTSGTGTNSTTKSTYPHEPLRRT